MRGALALLAALLATPAAADEVGAWQALREGGHVALVRHASTVAGLGDPAGYTLEDCATQRNLSGAGREEARRLGARFREHGVRIAKVYASPWCRCRDTAVEAFGRAEAWPPLGSFFEAPWKADDYTRRVRERIAWYATHPPGGTVVMVTHNVNIAALTRLSVGAGEVVVVRPDGCCGLRVVGRIAAEARS